MPINVPRDLIFCYLPVHAITATKCFEERIRLSTNTNRFKIGDEVTLRYSPDQVGTVVSEPTVIEGEPHYRIRFGPRVKLISGDDLVKADPFVDIEEMLEMNVLGPQSLLARRVALAKLRGTLRNAIYSLDSARTDFMPHQFKPLLKFVGENRQRILIADEVGLGKTIEAGYILRELRSREDIRRVMVVCPASIRLKWEAELARRFDERFEIIDSSDLRNELIKIRDDPQANRTRFQKIISIQSLRSRLGLLQTVRLELDLLIVDEAHLCRNNDTQQHRSVRELIDSSGSVVFLTATPLQTRDSDLFHLLNLLLPEDFPDRDQFDRRTAVNEHIVRAESILSRGVRSQEQISQVQSVLAGIPRSRGGEFLRDHPVLSRVQDRLKQLPFTNTQEIISIREELSTLNLLSHVMCRTRKREALPNAPVREAVTAYFSMTPIEMQAYQLFSAFYLSAYAEHRGDQAAQLVIFQFQRQLASSVQGTLLHYRQALHEYSRLDLEDDSVDDLQEESPTSSAFNLLEDECFRSLITQFDVDEIFLHDSRLEELLRILGKTGRKAVVFATFRKTLSYVEQCLIKAQIRCVRVDGSVLTDVFDPEHDERGKRVRQFREDPGIQVLLASQVLREGHDLQFCDVIVNWDLPWNPMDVEQRIGRLDRIGQVSPKIHIVSLCSRGTIDELIVERLYARVGLFEGKIGALEPILGELIHELQELIFDPSLTEEQRRDKLIQKTTAIETQRLALEKIEENQRELFGFDEIFAGRIDDVRRLGLYLAPAEIEQLLRLYLDVEHAGCPLREALRPGCFHLRIDARLRQSIRDAVPRDDPSLLSFEEATQRSKIAGDVKLTFEPGPALDDRQLVLVHAQHPLIRTARQYFEKHPNRLGRTVRVAVTSDEVPAGDYLFVLGVMEERSLRPGLTLVAELERLDESSVLVRRDSPGCVEALIHQAVLHGTDLSERSLSGIPVADLYRRCEERLSVRAIRRRDDAIRENTARLEVRGQTIRHHFGARIKREEAEILRIEQGGTEVSKRIIPAKRGKVAKFKADMKQKLHSLEACRSVTNTIEVEVAGLIRVTNKSETLHG